MTHRFILAALCLAGASAVPAFAQTTLPYDHVHLAAPEPAKAVAWYQQHLGGAPGELPDRVRFDKALLIWLQRAGSPKSEGGVIDHIAFTVTDVAAKTAELQGAGATVVAAPRDAGALGRQAILEDPWGVKLELLQDARASLHHMHLRLTDPAAAMRWYAERFGGERATFKGLDGLHYDGVWLFIDKVETLPAGSTGRAIDHLGWRVRDLTTAIAGHRAKGDKITSEPHPVRDNQVSMVDDPNGVHIEVIQRPVY